MTTISAPMMSTENHTVLLPVEIWLGGIKPVSYTHLTQPTIYSV